MSDTAVLPAPAYDAFITLQLSSAVGPAQISAALAMYARSTLRSAQSSGDDDQLVVARKVVASCADLSAQLGALYDATYPTQELADLVDEAAAAVVQNAA